jgi:hypothetical protein
MGGGWVRGMVVAISAAAGDARRVAAPKLHASFAALQSARDHARSRGCACTRCPVAGAGGAPACAYVWAARPSSGPRRAKRGRRVRRREARRGGRGVQGRTLARDPAGQRAREAAQPAPGIRAIGGDRAAGGVVLGADADSFGRPLARHALAVSGAEGHDHEVHRARGPAGGDQRPPLRRCLCGRARVGCREDLVVPRALSAARGYFPGGRSRRWISPAFVGRKPHASK